MNWPILLKDAILAALAGNWFTVLKLGLAILSLIAEIVRDRQLMNAGEAKATAKQLASMVERLRITEEIRSEVDALSEAEVDKELAKDDAGGTARSPFGL